MTEEDALDALEAKQRFFDRFRDSYRQLKSELTEEQLDYVFNDIHHAVNLYSAAVSHES